MLQRYAYRVKRLCHLLLLLPLLSSVLSACAAAPVARPEAEGREPSSGLEWKTLGGIELAVSEGLTIVRADPRTTPFVLLNPPETSSAGLAELAKREKLAVAINAAMFVRDYATSIGYMRNYERVNNPHVNPRLRGFLCWNPRDSAHPAVVVAGKECLPRYHSVFQTHRMIDGAGNILWKKGASIYRNVGLVGVDKDSRVLFFHKPALTDVHELVAGILALGLELRGLLYLDGGSHGALYLEPSLGRGVNTWITLPNVLGLRSP